MLNELKEELLRSKGYALHTIPGVTLNAGIKTEEELLKMLKKKSNNEELQVTILRFYAQYKGIVAQLELLEEILK